MFEILSNRGLDRIRWTNLLENVHNKDIYFTPEYMELFENSSDNISKNFGGEPKLALFGNDENYILYPFFKRSICQLDFYKQLALNYGELYDIITPWYFSGMLYKISNSKQFDPLFLKKFTSRFLIEFNEYCINQNIISEFMRLHPFSDNCKLLQCLGSEVKKSNDVIYVNLELDESRIFKNFKKSNRNCISKSKRNNVRVFQSTDNYYIAEFYRLYTTNMERLNADEKYYFSKPFFDKIFESLQKNSTLFVAEYAGSVIAVSLFIYKYGFVHYYLSASDSNFNKLCPINLIIYEAIMWAKEKGYQILELGGGYKLNDNLYKFKSSFSKDSVDFCTYSKIHNEKIYQILCNARNEYDRINGCSDSINSEYFPAYRR